MAAEALAGHVAVMRGYGDALPEPSTYEGIRSRKTWLEENDVEWGNAMLAPIAVRTPVGKPERVTISMDSNVLREIDAYAQKSGQTRSSVLTAGAELFLGRGVEQMSDLALEAIAAQSATQVAREAPKSIEGEIKRLGKKKRFKRYRNVATGELQRMHGLAMVGGSSRVHAAAKKK